MKFDSDTWTVLFYIVMIPVVLLFGIASLSYVCSTWVGPYTSGCKTYYLSEIAKGRK